MNASPVDHSLQRTPARPSVHTDPSSHEDSRRMHQCIMGFFFYINSHSTNSCSSSSPWYQFEALRTSDSIYTYPTVHTHLYSINVFWLKSYHYWTERKVVADFICKLHFIFVIYVITGQFLLVCTKKKKNTSQSSKRANFIKSTINNIRQWVKRDQVVELKVICFIWLKVGTWMVFALILLSEG